MLKAFLTEIMIRTWVRLSDPIGIRRNVSGPIWSLSFLEFGSRTHHVNVPEHPGTAKRIKCTTPLRKIVWQRQILDIVENGAVVALNLGGVK